jgi:hypothetical protein
MAFGRNPYGELLMRLLQDQPTPDAAPTPTPPPGQPARTWHPTTPTNTGPGYLNMYTDPNGSYYQFDNPNYQQPASPGQGMYTDPRLIALIRAMGRGGS